jgi:transcriptional regulator with XRE-family HTH domain
MSRSSFAEALHDRLAGVDIAAVAADLGATQRTVRSWARGERVPPPATVFALERHLNLPPGALSTHLGYLPASMGDVSRELHADAARMAREEVARYRADLPADAGALLDHGGRRTGGPARRATGSTPGPGQGMGDAHGPLTERERQAARQELGLATEHAVAVIADTGWWIALDRGQRRAMALLDEAVRAGSHAHHLGWRRGPGVAGLPRQARLAVALRAADVVDLTTPRRGRSVACLRRRAATTWSMATSQSWPSATRP